MSAAPLAQARVMRTGVPTITGSPYAGDGRVRVRHREYVADVSTSGTTFEVTSFSLNPGLSASFPWLSCLAQLYESYVFHDLRIIYETQKSASTDGTVMLAVDFDATDVDPANKQQLMSYHNAVRSAVWQECMFVCSREDLKKLPQRYVRMGDLAANQDVKTYDVGNLFAAVQGLSSSGIGELYVEYDVELITPQLDPNARLDALCAVITGAGSVSKSAPFGSAATKEGGLAVSAVSSTLTFSRVGQYLVTLNYTGSSLVGTDAFTLGGTAESAKGTVADTTRVSANGAAAVLAFFANVSERGQTVSVDMSGFTGTVSTTTTTVAPFAFALL
jgi:hypothetical protein